MLCPCGSGKKYKKCCQPFHKEKAKPKTALELMKSRYSAYAKGEVKYIIKTTAKEFQKELNENEIKLFCQSNFKKLEIVEFSENIVEFKAYIDDYILHEKSEFIKENFEWKYLKECEDIVVKSIDEYASLKETKYLLSTKTNTKHLQESIKELREGRIIEKNIKKSINL